MDLGRTTWIVHFLVLYEDHTKDARTRRYLRFPWHTMADNRDKLQDFIDAFTSEIKLLDASGT